MAWKPPINRQANKNFIKDDERFYRLLGEQCNFVNRDLAFLFYMGLVHIVGQELERHKIVRLPHLGDMALITQKARPAWIGRAHVRIDEREVLKFYPKEHFRRYFNARQGPPRILGF